MGKYLRLASWNIEKSYRAEAAVDLWTSREKFERMIDPAKVSIGSSNYKEILGQREKLANVDIVVLQEMDIGVKRSGYIDAARELAQALDMNYAYGAEYLEVDPVYLGLEKIFYEDATVDDEASDYYTVDPARYKGAFAPSINTPNSFANKIREILSEASYNSFSKQARETAVNNFSIEKVAKQYEKIYEELTKN